VRISLVISALSLAERKDSRAYKVPPNGCWRFAAIGAAVTSVTSVVPVGLPNTPQIRSGALGAPVPQDPAAGPIVDQMAGVLSGLRAPGVAFVSKGNPIQEAPIQEAGVGV
jgi:hypothetical protein